MVIWVGIDDFFYAMSINERSNTTSWHPIFWPLRGVIPLACPLLFVQGISDVTTSVLAARTGQFLVHQEKLEL
jgi:TRAP-type mannitol/chloroaromatic compound transport system permease small subunit